MKLKNTLFLLSFFFLAQTLTAQNCEGFYPFEPDTKIEMTHYDRKGKVNSITESTIIDITEMDGVVEAEVSARVLDKKGEELNLTDFTIACKNDAYEVDVSNMVNPMMMSNAYGMELDISGDALIFPNDLEVGEKLESASAVIEVRSSDIKIMTMKFDISNREVKSKESITTPAGTFDCYKVTYEFNTKVAFVKKKYKITQWIADGVGVVKDETYNKKGKLESTSVLTKFEKP